MIPRDIENELNRCRQEYPVITITGPRQSGKTTLARAAFRELPYVSFEDPLQRDYFNTDPRGFFLPYQNGAVFDEVQHVPRLASHLQVWVDEHLQPGRFVLTGSRHFGLTEQVTQSLAGRTAILELFPFNLRELKRGTFIPTDMNRVLWAGGYPPVHDRQLRPERWYVDYLATYVQRDLRQISQIQNLDSFIRFIRICAGQVGQLLNTARLGNEIGVDHKTIRKWLSVLQTSYIINLLEPYHRNFRKRIVKAPKLYFYDTGLVCSLLGIRSPEQLMAHPLRGEIFENWVYSELAKELANRGQPPRFYFWRTHGGQEVDFLIEQGTRLWAIETKSGMTVHPEMVKKLQNAVSSWEHEGVPTSIIYGGNEKRQILDCQIVPWNEFDKFLDEMFER
ncbi:MAG: ATP-binding protein [Calditrichaeota bacterium]|nr:MAG: ATP-binding protein [Calditrichota bacterium]